MTRFKSPVRHSRSGDGGLQHKALSNYSGLPVGIELLSDFFIYKNDFVKANDLPTDTVDWTVTSDAGSPALTADEFPTWCRLTTGGTDDNKHTLQYSEASASGDTFNLLAGKLRYFETALRFGESTIAAATTLQEMEFFAGVAFPLTTPATEDLVGATSGTPQSPDYIGFISLDGDDDIRFVAGKSNASTFASQIDQVIYTFDTTLVTGDAEDTDDNDEGTWFRLGFLCNGTEDVIVYGSESDSDPLEMPALEPLLRVNPTTGSPTSGTRTDDLPDDVQMCLSFEIKTGEAAARTMDIAYILMALER